jgi:alkanesulfonate monooxygenase SsuD/methylene tetrahydromethanopterin reductase-like flavin-dependent oxidoreductase (luciferase family)
MVGAMFLMRFAMRSHTQDPSARAALYRTALEMTEWAQDRGCASTIVSEHHAVDDGYLPSPVPLAAAMAARTTTMPINVSALLVALYEPVKLAEDLAVVDLLSAGRVSYVIGIGYRNDEFDMFGIDRRTRGQLVEDRVRLLRRLWTGASAEVDGRTVRVRPLPFTPGGPLLAYGGGTLAAAKRAGRLGLYFMANSADISLESAYREEAARAGVRPLGCRFMDPSLPLTVFVAEDPDKAWAQIGDYLLLDAVGYAGWNSGSSSPNVSNATTVEQLRAERGAYQILTPDEAAAQIAGGNPLALQPLVGGIPPEIAWPYLECAAALGQ